LLISIELIRERLQQQLPGTAAHERMAARIVPMPTEMPADARPGAVLSLLFPVDEQLHLLFIKRAADGKAHSGQIGFPGGKQDPSDADLRTTALRETHEEVGIMSADIEILAALTPLYIPVSNFKVHPFIAYTPQRPQYNINHSEVEHVLEIPITDLFAENCKTTAEVISPAYPDKAWKVKAYRLPNGTVIWGATAMMLSELEALLCS
jgi:8-oxo-dGTP pyrophosphatase MutT (NUDIX family)